MKKTLVVMMAFVLGLAITSCKQGPKVVDAAEAAADPAKTLTELVDKAKAEGANWSVDEWKDAFKTAMACVAPTMKEVQELTSSLQTKEGEEPDTAKLAEVMTKLGELKVKYDPIENLISQFDSISKSYPNGKAVSDDKEFEKAMMKEVGIEDM